jgi:hypothetical protein
VARSFLAVTAEFVAIFARARRAHARYAAVVDEAFAQTARAAFEVPRVFDQCLTCAGRSADRGVRGRDRSGIPGVARGHRRALRRPDGG